MNGKIIVPSTARRWPQLQADISDEYIGARHRELGASQWHLDLVIDPALLRVETGAKLGGEAQALSHWLNDMGLAYRLHVKREEGPVVVKPGHLLIFHYQT